MKEIIRAKRLFKENLRLMSALGDPARQKLILLMLEGKPKTVKELTELMSISRPTVSHHIKILNDANILAEHRKGMKRYYYPRIGPHIKPVKELLEAIEKLEVARQKQD